MISSMLIIGAGVLTVLISRIVKCSRAWARNPYAISGLEIGSSIATCGAFLVPEICVGSCATGKGYIVRVNYRTTVREVQVYGSTNEVVVPVVHGHFTSGKTQFVSGSIVHELYIHRHSVTRSTDRTPTSGLVKDG
jgi:hypothetical protein